MGGIGNMLFGGSDSSVSTITSRPAVPPQPAYLNVSDTGMDTFYRKVVLPTLFGIQVEGNPYKLTLPGISPDLQNNPLAWALNTAQSQSPTQQGKQLQYPETGNQSMNTVISDTPQYGGVFGNTLKSYFDTAKKAFNYFNGGMPAGSGGLGDLLTMALMKKYLVDLPLSMSTPYIQRQWSPLQIYPYQPAIQEPVVTQESSGGILSPIIGALGAGLGASLGSSLINGGTLGGWLSSLF